MNFSIKKWKNSEGYSLFETIVVLAIFLVLSGVLFSFLFLSIQSFTRGTKALKACREIVLIDSSIRKMTEQIYIPYWESSSYTVKSYVDTYFRTVSWKNLVLSYSFIFDKQNKIQGIVVKYKLSDGSVLETVSSFGIRFVLP